VIVCCLLLLLLGAGESHEAQRLLVSLEQETFPQDYQPDFGKPRLFRIFTEPMYPILNAPAAAADLPVYGTVSLGCLTSLPVLITQWPDSGEDYTSLYLDLNFNGDFSDDGPPWRGERTRRYGHATIFFPDVLFSLSREAFVQNLFLPRYPSLHDGTVSPKEVNWVTPQTLYQCAIRLSLTLETEIPRVAHFYYQCWMRGSLSIGKTAYDLYLLDGDSNGCYTGHDRWALMRTNATDGSQLPKTEADFSLITETLRVGDGTLWKVHKLRPDGTRVLLARTGQESNRSSMAALKPPPPQLFPVAEEEIPWEPLFKKAVEKSAQTGKPIMLLLTAPDCAFSQAYLQVTFRDANIVELVRQVVPVHIECVQNEVTDGINVPGFPYILFLDAKLAIAKRVSGYCTAPVLAEYLKSVIRAFPLKTQ